MTVAAETDRFQTFFVETLDEFPLYLDVAYSKNHREHSVQRALVQSVSLRSTHRLDIPLVHIVENNKLVVHPCERSQKPYTPNSLHGTISDRRRVYLQNTVKILVCLTTHDCGVDVLTICCDASKFGYWTCWSRCGGLRGGLYDRRVSHSSILNPYVVI